MAPSLPRPREIAMDSGSHELSGRGRLIRWLRWAGLLPAALLARVAIQFLAEMGYTAVASATGEPAGSPSLSALWLLLFYAPKEAGFVIAGAKVAPRGRLAAAPVLA